MRASNPWDWTPEELAEAVQFLPRHGADCALVTSHSVVCTCGTLSRFHAMYNALAVQNWREGYAAGRDDEAAGEPVWDRSANATGERRAT